jgi:hypothetical protein
MMFLWQNSDPYCYLAVNRRGGGNLKIVKATWRHVSRHLLNQKQGTMQNEALRKNEFDSLDCAGARRTMP